MSGRPGKASRHWRNQRMTAVALIPLGLWFIVSLLRQPTLEYAIVAGWFAKPLQALLGALLGLALLWHSLQGIEVVLEDYVRGRALAVATGIARLVHVAAAVVLAYAIYRLARGGAP